MFLAVASAVHPRNGFMPQDVNAGSQTEGYIVSHWNYDNYNYYHSNINNTLKLTGLNSRDLNISILEFSVSGFYETCNDYLQISSKEKFCGSLQLPYNFTVHGQEFVTFQFKTAWSAHGRSGFKLFYQGNALQFLSVFAD